MNTPAAEPDPFVDTLAQRKLRRAEALLRVASAFGRLGTWDVELHSMRLQCSEEVCAIFDLPAGCPWTLHQAVQYFIPQDRAALMHAFVDCMDKGQSLDLQLQVVTAQGRRIWVHVAAEAERGALGEIVRVQGAAQDIHRQRILESALRDAYAALEKCVAEQSAELQRVIEEREALSYAIAHDLRAPLASINGFTRAFLEHEASQLSPKGRHHLERVISRTSQMGAMIDGLLRLASLSRKHLELEPIDLSSLCHEIGTNLRSGQEHRTIDLVIEPDMHVDADRVLLTLALNNLLGNAWKFTTKQPHARIEVGTSHHEDVGHAIYVKDNGAGFDPGCADKLFKPFQRLHRCDEFEGTGIGLAIVRKIIQLHDGDIWAESMPGQGATFNFSLACPREVSC